jgi:hypothetical protein
MKPNSSLERAAFSSVSPRILVNCFDLLLRLESVDQVATKVVSKEEFGFIFKVLLVVVDGSFYVLLVIVE